MPRKSALKMYLELQEQNAAAKGGDATIGGKLAIKGRSNGSAKAGAKTGDKAGDKASKKLAAKVEDVERGALKMPAGDAEKMKAEFNAPHTRISESPKTLFRNRDAKGEGQKCVVI